MVVVIAFLVPLAWLLGTFPSAPIVARAKGRDVLAEGSGNPGASNVARLLGWRYGALVLVLDFAKGAIPTAAGLVIEGRAGAFILGGAAILGHVYPLYRKGGKGVAAGAGMMVVLYPVIAVIFALVWVLVARVLKKASLASLLVVVACPFAVAIGPYETWEIVVVGAFAALVVVRHAANIRRLLRREEMDIRSSGASAS